MTALLEARGEGFRITILGPIRQPAPHLSVVESTIVAQGFETVIAVGHDSTSTFSLHGSPLFFEETSYDVIVENATLEFAPGTPISEKWASNGATYYTLKLGSYAGEICLGVSNALSSATLCIEVFPSKIDYRSDYEDLIDDLESLSKGLSFALMGHTAGGGASMAASSSSADWVMRAQRVAMSIYREVSHIAQHGAKSRVLTAKRIVSLQRALRMPPGRLRDTSLRNVRYGAQNLAVQVRTETFDTPINRIIKHEIATIQTKLKGAISTLKRRAVSDRYPDKASLNELIRRLEEARKLLGMSANHEFVASAGKISANDWLALTSPHDMRYSRLLGNLALFRRVASIHVDRRDVPTERISQLYEWWTFLKLASSLSKYLQPATPQKSLPSVRNGEVTMHGGAAYALTFHHRKTGTTARLVYQSQSVESATARQRPDAIFELSTVGGWYVFDAKYRIQYDDSYLKAYKVPGPKVDDINTAHRYRDAVLSRHRRVVDGSFVIFPFKPAKMFRNSRFFKSIREVNVGAIPLLPGEDELLDYVIRRVLRKGMRSR